MVKLIEITEENYQIVCSLKVADDQKSFVAPPVGILARAYAKRSRNAHALAVVNGETIIGVVMYMELFEEPACYTIEQFLIDKQYQGNGYGKQALLSVINLLAKERKYEAIEICVKMAALRAISLYRSIGFIDTGYIDPEEPDSYCLRYMFA